MRGFIAILIGKLLYKILIILKKRGGSLPGKIAKRIYKDILKYFKFSQDIIIVTGTNGKTTTTNWVTNMFAISGYNIVTNKAGDNIDNGIITTLITNSTLTGKIKGDVVILEIDESWLAKIFKDIPVSTLVVLNFFRDQLDRVGEIENIISKLEYCLRGFNGNLVLNGDDPNVARLQLSNSNNENVWFFGTDKYEESVVETLEASEGRFCPVCKSRLKYEYYQYSHIGSYKCENCNFGNIKYFNKAKEIDINIGTFKLNEEEYFTKYNTIYQIYNALATITVANIYKIQENIIKESLEDFQIGNGRQERFQIDNTECILNLAKNPTGVNETIKSIIRNEENKDILVVLNDNVQDGRDVSWIWDVQFENLINPQTNRIICSGIRAYDLAIRFKYTGFPINQIEVHVDLEKAIDVLLKSDLNKYIIANYSSLQPTRKLLLQKVNGEKNGI